MLYNFFRLLFEIAYRIFFRRTKENNKDRLPTEGPLILVANHPSTFMDPMVVARMLRQQVYFLGKGSLFTSPLVSWVLSRIMNVIPIYRTQDDPSKIHLNDQIFSKCYEHLESKGTILIFPEGTSILERRLRRVKTGTARIALGAEAKNNFQLGLKIVSIGINYSDPSKFRSDIEINVEEPIIVADFKDKYLENDREAVRELTEQIRVLLEKNLIITDDDNEDELVKNIETVYRQKLIENLDVDLDAKFENFTITKGIVNAVNYFEAKEPERVKALDEKMDNYFETLRILQLKDNVFAKEQRNRNIVANTLRKGIYMLLTFPFYLYGLIHNFLPYRIPGFLAKRITPHIEYVGPTMMVLGILTFPIFYGLYVWLFHDLTGGIWWLTLLYSISLPISGFFVLHYWKRLKIYKDHIRLYSLFYKRTNLISSLIQQRSAIVKELEKAQEEYMNRRGKNGEVGG